MENRIQKLYSRLSKANKCIVELKKKLTAVENARAWDRGMIQNWKDYAEGYQEEYGKLRENLEKWKKSSSNYEHMYWTERNERAVFEGTANRYKIMLKNILHDKLDETWYIKMANKYSEMKCLDLAPFEDRVPEFEDLFEDLQLQEQFNDEDYANWCLTCGLRREDDYAFAYKYGDNVYAKAYAIDLGLEEKDYNPYYNLYYNQYEDENLDPDEEYYYEQYTW